MRTACLALLVVGSVAPAVMADTATYDALGRLKELFTSGRKSTYTYDNADNRTAYTVVTGGLSSSVDVGVSGAASPAGAVIRYHKISYAVLVSNFSGSAASTLSLTFTPAASMTLLSTTASGWSCSGTGTVTCTRATLASNTDSALTFEYRPTVESGNATATAVVSSAGTDIQTANNTETITSMIRSSGDDADVDGDGMADAWETSYGLDTTNPDDAALDPDNDGMSNLVEYAQNTTPVFDQRAIAPLLNALW